MPTSGTPRMDRYRWLGVRFIFAWRARVRGWRSQRGRGRRSTSAWRWWCAAGRCRRASAPRATTRWALFTVAGAARARPPLQGFAKNARAVIVFKYHGTRSSCLFIIIDSRQPLARRMRCSLVLSMSFIRATKYASAAVKQLLIRSGAACGTARKSTAAGAVHQAILIAQHNGPLK